MRPMKFSLTLSGKYLLGFTMLLLAAVLMNGHNLLYLLVSSLMAILLLGAVIPHRLVRRAAVSLMIPDEWYVRTPAYVTCRITLPRWGQGLPVQVEWCGGKWESEGEQACEVLHRGHWAAPEVQVTSSVPFGIASVVLTIAPTVMTHQGFVRREWVVFPRLRPLTAEEVERVVREYAGGTSSPHEPLVEISSVRPYRSGDDLRLIHWKASAKRGGMMVKEFEADSHQAVVLQVPPVFPSEDSREEELSLIASAVAELIAQDRVVQLRLGGWATPFGSGRSHLLDMLRALALS